MWRDPRLPTRFWNKVAVDEATQCWIWTAALNPDGYANLIVGSRTDGSRRLVTGHVLAYETLVNRVPQGLELDHKCDRRNCVNPQHLNPTTHRANVLRGTSPSAKAAAATHCPSGHPYDKANTYRRPNGNRDCRKCRRLRHRARRAARSAA